MAILKIYDGSAWLEIPILDGVPGGELGGTWASPTVDSTHSGSAHHASAHTVASHSDTTGTGAELETLTDGSETALHSHAGGGTHAILDGSTHSDSVADAVTRGSLIYGNSTPKWDELGIGAAGAVLSSDGTDASWVVPDRTIVLSALGGAPTTTNGCAGAVQVEAGTNDVDYWVMDFDKDSDEYAFWDGMVMPDNWDGGTLTAVVHWTTASGGAAETVRWAISMIAIANDDPIDQAWGTAVNVDDTWIADGDEHISGVSGAITPATSSTRAGGNSLRVRVMRDISGDDLGGDARLMKVKLEYTTDAVSD